MSAVRVYGTEWCRDTQRTREVLKQLKVPYEFVNIERDASAREWVKQQNHGKEQKPTVIIGNQVLSVPSDDLLFNTLREEGLLDK